VIGNKSRALQILQKGLRYEPDNRDLQRVQSTGPGKRYYFLARAAARSFITRVDP
jgi:hypothetical protein